MDQVKASISEQNNWILALCPNTGEEVIGSGWQEEISLKDILTTWWQCPACHGWHIKNSACDNSKGYGKLL